MTSPLCTVLIAFDSAGQRRFAALQKVGAGLGFETLRVAQYYSSGMILEEIVRSTRDAHLVIADLTGGNPNVYYELGIAHALGKRVFLVAEHPEACPLNFGALRVHAFDESQGSIDRLNRELQAFVETPGTLSPIDTFSGGTAVAGQQLVARRFAAFAVDCVIAMVIAGIVLAAIWYFKPELGDAYELIAPIAYAYLLLAGTLLGTTPGQRVLGLQVTRLDRSAPSLGDKFLRPVASMLTLLSMGVGFLWAARSPRFQTLHDIITRTLVLRRNTFDVDGHR